ncbi:MAG TPA: hypothetical protein VID50_06370 [Candidatus Eisenbacteria bacterium]
MALATAFLALASPFASAGTKGSAPPSGALPKAQGRILPQAGAWWQQHGGFFHAGTDRSLPAVFLIHANHQSARDWTEPSNIQQHYAYRSSPGTKSLGKKSVPNAGVYKVAASPWLDVDTHSWVAFLRAKGYTVAGYTQSPGTIAEVMDEAGEAFDQFLKDTAALGPAPPPVAIVGHSRGGLIARHLLKRKDAAGRVKWLITLHTPHQGSEMANAPERIADSAVEAVGGANLPEPFQSELRSLARSIAAPLRRLIDDQSRELRPGSPMLLALKNGERPLDGIRYFTFGGTNPNYYRLYVWTFTAMSSVPQYKGLEQYFVWKVKPAEIGPASPMYASVRDVAPEITPGKGDGLVSDARARLPEAFHAEHVTDELNHAEVLWDPALQARVDRILRGSGGAERVISKAAR